MIARRPSRPHRDGEPLGASLQANYDITMHWTRREQERAVEGDIEGARSGGRGGALAVLALESERIVAGGAGPVVVDILPPPVPPLPDASLL
jgi:hypothetical protein